MSAASAIEQNSSEINAHSLSELSEVSEELLLAEMGQILTRRADLHAGALIVRCPLPRRARPINLDCMG